MASDELTTTGSEEDLTSGTSSQTSESSEPTSDPLSEVTKLFQQEGIIPELAERTSPEEHSEPLDADADPSAAPQEETEAEEPTGPIEADTVKELAEKLGLDAQKLYKVKIGIPGGEPVTLEDLKKSYVTRADAERELIAKDDALAGREAALHRDLNMARELLAEARIEPGKVQELQARQQETLQKEREALMVAVPEFKEGAAFDEFRDKATELMSSYGLRPQEQNITDHRVVLMIRDFIKTRERLDRLLKFKPEDAKPSKPVKARVPTNSKQASQALAVKRARTGTEADKLAAVAKLLEG